MDNRLYKLFEYLREDFEGRGHPLCPTCDYCDDYPSHEAGCIFADLLENPPQKPLPVPMPAKPIKASTLHFKANTTHAQTEAFFEALSEIADGWEARQLEQVRLFFAGITDVYMSVKARWGVEGPGWPGGKRDFEYRGRNLRRIVLQGRPHPERHWQGQWREFNSAAELKAYAEERLEKLVNLRAAA